MASSARVVVGLPRSSRVAAAVALIEAEAQCSVLGVVLRVLGQQRGRSSNRRRASPIDQCLRSSARASVARCPSMLFSFFFHFALSGGRAPFCCGEACEPYLHWWWKLVVC